MLLCVYIKYLGLSMFSLLLALLLIIAATVIYNRNLVPKSKDGLRRLPPANTAEGKRIRLRMVFVLMLVLLAGLVILQSDSLEHSNTRAFVVGASASILLSLYVYMRRQRN